MCVEKKLVIEIDGGDHWMRKAKDMLRDRRMQQDGFFVLRFNNTQVRNSVDWVLDQIRIALERDRFV